MYIDFNSVWVHIVLYGLSMVFLFGVMPKVFEWMRKRGYGKPW